jgi:hypothetical protein
MAGLSGESDRPASVFWLQAGLHPAPGKPRLDPGSRASAPAAAELLLQLPQVPRPSSVDMPRTPRRLTPPDLTARPVHPTLSCALGRNACAVMTISVSRPTV